ncbi:MAG: signal peptidase I [Chloroflexi bacterium RBG_16_56_11]|nr:MAG: signal peptidase I [Chloroflexi bacterium RBG_16_56_11]
MGKKFIEFSGMLIVLLLMSAAALVFMAPRFGWRVDTVSSGSMDPALKTGGVVITRPVGPEQIAAGDIITFRSPVNDALTSHRVTMKGGGPPYTFRTRGDANEEADPFAVTEDKVVGKVCFHLPYLGYVAGFVQTRLGLLLTLCVPGGLIIIREMINIWRVLTGNETERRYRI